MLKHTLITLAAAICILAPSTIAATPLGLPWGTQVSENFQEIKGFRYWYGDSKWGEIIFLGRFADLEAEIQLQLSGRYITKAIFILGPGGIHQGNCFVKFKQITKLLNTKYGKFYFTNVKQHSDIAELIYADKCRPFKLGLQEVTRHWHHEEFRITMSLWGDGSETFIEIEYSYIPLANSSVERKKKKLLEML